MDHGLLLDRLSVMIKDRRVLNLIVQYLMRTAERGGLYWEHTKGIPLGFLVGADAGVEGDPRCPGFLLSRGLHRTSDGLVLDIIPNVR